jgi:uncharacterized protein (TIGR01777 family)
MRVFITGGTGLVGRRLVARLVERGDRPIVLSRNRASAQTRLGSEIEVVEGDPTIGSDWTEVLGTCDAVVNLAGENIFARRWNEEFKAKIRDSRVEGTTNVVAAIVRAEKKPSVLVNASAVGYYGPHGGEELTEYSPPGNDFLAGACIDWENAARVVEAASVRLVIARIGVVMAIEEGALTKMLTPFKLGVGGPVGSGRQWMAWIHVDDVVGIILHAIDHAAVSGVVNATAPVPVTNREFSKSLGRTLGRPAIFPIPVFMLRLRFGQVAEVIASGQRVLPMRTQELGYQFQHASIDGALAALLRR